MNRALVFAPGERYGLLTGQCKTVGGYALYKCDCGTTKPIRVYQVHSGVTQACGCLQKKRSIAAMKLSNSKHGMYGSREHTTWTGMLSRCRNPKAHAYSEYGGREITVSKRWFEFSNFYEDMGPRPKGTSLDRKDNELGYCKDNCRWATRKEQGANTRSNIILEANGESMTQSQWATRLGVADSAIYTRLKRGWSVERAVTQPAQKRKK